MSNKRRSDDDNVGSRKSPKVGGSATAGGPKMSFAQKMMAKMGYQEGQGLGKTGDGMLTPIEVKLRPQGAGVGAVREKTEQAKAEARRAAERRGEEYEDSSEEERKARRRRKEASKAKSSSGISTPGRPKQKFRTIADIEEDSGLEVPNVFKSLIDATGREPKLLTSTAGLMVPQQAPQSTAEIERAKISKMAHIELEAFAQRAQDNQGQLKYLDIQHEQIQRELQAEEDELVKFRALSDAVQDIVQQAQLPQQNGIADHDQEQIEAVCSKLEKLQDDYAGISSDFSSLAIALIQPTFKSSMFAWNPIEDGSDYPARFLRLSNLLGIHQEMQLILNGDDTHNGFRTAKSSPYESMMSLTWLPKIRSTIFSGWNPTNAAPMLSLIQQWRKVLPRYIYDIVVNQLIVERLVSTLDTWKPGSSRKGSIPNPHEWIFPWLEYLDEYHLDAKSQNGLLTHVKRKFRSVFTRWDPSKGMVDDLMEWRELKSLRVEMDKDLVSYLLPRLARYLSDNFEIDPADQDITPIEMVLKWKDVFRTSVLSRLLVAEFFPKWQNVLHVWLTSDPNYEEVGQWYTWWNDIFPPEVAASPDVAAEWERGLQMINRAMDLGPDRVKTELPLPAAGPQRSIVKETIRKQKAQEQASKDVRDTANEAMTLKDVVEEMCEAENLLLIPTREAHPSTGLPLFRVTASATGKGGVMVYFKGDIVWAQNKRDRSAWEPINLEEGALTTLATAK